MGGDGGPLRRQHKFVVFLRPTKVDSILRFHSRFVSRLHETYVVDIESLFRLQSVDVKISIMGRRLVPILMCHANFKCVRSRKPFCVEVECQGVL